MNATGAVNRRSPGVLPAVLASVPFGVIRPRDARGVYRHPAQEFRRLEQNGLLHRLSHGYYAVVPMGVRDRKWLPTIEAAAYGIAAATYEPDQAILAGVSAARMHDVIPRALAVAVVAIPLRRPPIDLEDRRGRVLFQPAMTDALDAVRIETDLGTALVTSAEQTALDLAWRPRLGNVEPESIAAARRLWPRCDPNLLNELARKQRKVAALSRLLRLVDDRA